MINRVLLPRQVLGSNVDGGSLLAEITVAQCKTMDLDANETRGIGFSQYYFLRWMCYVVNQSRRGPERQSMSFMCSSMTGVKVTRMNPIE